jgi:type II secretory pathway pseudopilin PulG
MKTSTKSNRGFSIVSTIVAIILIGIATAGIVKFAGAYGTHMQQMNTLVQENSYRVFQNELALSGASPLGMGTTNPLSGSYISGSSPTPYSQMVAGAGRTLTGSATVGAYATTQDMGNRSGALGFRISPTGTAVPAPPATPLAPPSFLYSGVVPEAAFSPNLTGEIVSNAGNPPGTVYRYTIDGTSPNATSPIWISTSFLTAFPLPATLRAAAFNSDPDWSQSAVVSAALSRNLTINYSRSLGGASTGFLYTDVTGGTNNIVLTIPNMPPGTVISYTYDGSNPASSGTAVSYAAPFQVPIGAWSASVTLQATATVPASNITVGLGSWSLTPIQVAMPTPTFGGQTPQYSGGQPALEPNSVLIPVFSTISGAVLRWSVNTPITGASPTTSSGLNISVTAP